MPDPVIFLAMIAIGVVAYCLGHADGRDAQRKVDERRRRADRIIATIEEAGRMTP